MHLRCFSFCFALVVKKSKLQADKFKFACFRASVCTLFSLYSVYDRRSISGMCFDSAMSMISLILHSLIAVKIKRRIKFILKSARLTFVA